MPPATSPRDPVPGAPAGLADHTLPDIRRRVLGPWDELLAVAHDCDHSTPLALRGWTARELFVHLGRWEDRSVMHQLLDSAATGAMGEAEDPDEVNARVIAAHAGAGRDEVLAALTASRDSVAQFLGSPDDVERLGRALTVSPVGRVPLLQLVQAGAFELAVHLMDLERVGLTTVSARSFDAGVAALVDVTGMLMAKHHLDREVSVVTPDGGWTAETVGDGWTTASVMAGTPVRTGVTGKAADVLAMTSGRGNILTALPQRRIVVHGLGRMLELAPIITEVPGIPGRQALAVAATTLGTTGRVLGRLPGFRR